MFGTHERQELIGLISPWKLRGDLPDDLFRRRVHAGELVEGCTGEAGSESSWRGLLGEAQLVVHSGEGRGGETGELSDPINPSRITVEARNRMRCVGK